MSQELSKESVVNSEIMRLKELHEDGDYFSVVIKSPQLIVKIIDVLASYDEEWRASCKIPQSSGFISA